METLVELKVLFWIQILTAMACLQRSIEYLLLLNDCHFLNFLKSMNTSAVKINFKALEFAGVILGFGLFFDLRFSIGILLIQFLRYVVFRGPFNGGSDSMLNVLLLGLTISAFGLNGSHWLLKFGILVIGVQAALSYWIAGLAKCRSTWWDGQALFFIFQKSNYLIPNLLKKFFSNLQVCRFCSISILAFELALPTIFISMKLCAWYLIFAVAFHFAIAFAFGLNRFLWTWPATYPAVLYLVSLTSA